MAWGVEEFASLAIGCFGGMLVALWLMAKAIRQARADRANLLKAHTSLRAHLMLVDELERAAKAAEWGAIRHAAHHASDGHILEAATRLQRVTDARQIAREARRAS